MDTLTIEKIRAGGFVVRRSSSIERGNYPEIVFSCTTLDEAFDYIRKNMGA